MSRQKEETSRILLLEVAHTVVSRPEMWGLLNLKDFISFLLGADYGLLIAEKQTLVSGGEFNEWMRNKYGFAGGVSWTWVVQETFPKGTAGMEMLVNDLTDYSRDWTLRHSQAQKRPLE